MKVFFIKIYWRGPVNVPEEKLGRVSSIDTLGSFVLLPFKFSFTGWLIDHVDVGVIFITAGNLAAPVSLLLLFRSTIRISD